MITYDDMKNIYKNCSISEKLSNTSDLGIELTWDNDIQSKKCYIYDYYHDNQPELKDHMEYDYTTKTPIDAKFIITSYGSISKDQVEAHIMFRPSQKLEFSPIDDLYYYETDYKEKYQSEFPIGLYIDIPNKQGIYEKWIICMIEKTSNHYIKYSVLPCTYRLQWVEYKENNRLLRSMWCCLRSQNSYNSGLWTNKGYTTLDNVDTAILPMNQITEELWYNDKSDANNIRVIVSSSYLHPNVWSISKVENVHPFGLQKVTFKADSFDSNRDYVNYETKEMYANYYDLSGNVPENKKDTIVYIKGSSTIKVGYPKKYYAEYGDGLKHNNGKWEIISDYNLEYDINGCVIEIKILDNNAIGNKIKLQYKIKDLIMSEKIINVVDAF